MAIAAVRTKLATRASVARRLRRGGIASSMGVGAMLAGRELSSAAGSPPARDHGIAAATGRWQGRSGILGMAAAARWRGRMTGRQRTLTGAGLALTPQRWTVGHGAPVADAAAAAVASVSGRHHITPTVVAHRRRSCRRGSRWRPGPRCWPWPVRRPARRHQADPLGIAQRAAGGDRDLWGRQRRPDPLLARVHGVAACHFMAVSAFFCWSVVPPHGKTGRS